MGEFQPPYDYPKIKEPSSKPVLPAAGSIKYFIDLLDTFNDYTDQGLKFLRVSADETRIEVTDIAFISDRNFIHSQPVASDNWGTINHALGKRPCIQIFNEAGEPARANITHTDDNNVTITSDVAFAGAAYFN